MAEKISRKHEAAPAQQQQVLSIRVTEALRYRLEHLKKVHFLKTSESVSTSEVAKQLLESADDDRLEFAKLLSDPMKALLNARRKMEAKLPLSQTEWMVVAYYCHQGAEAFSDSLPNQISNESLAGILEAFLAVYGLQNAKHTPRDPLYLANLPPDEDSEMNGKQELECEDVRRVVRKTIQALRSRSELPWKPILSARNLFYVLDETELPNIQKLNQALMPYWPILWRVCARGHYFQQGKPVLDEPSGKDTYGPMVVPQLPAFEEGDCSLFLPCGRNGDFALCLNLPGQLSPMYPMSDFVMICEFRAMLEQFNPEQERSSWPGYYFVAYATRSQSGEIIVTFRARENGITFHLESGAWKAFRNLLRRAWDHPEVRRLWDGEVLRYGEF